MGRRSEISDAAKHNIQITKKAKTRFLAWVAGNRKPAHSETIGDIVEWFLDQTPEVQQMVLHRTSQQMNAMYAVMLRTMADELVRPPARGPAHDALVGNDEGEVILNSELPTKSQPPGGTKKRSGKPANDHHG